MFELRLYTHYKYEITSCEHGILTSCRLYSLLNSCFVWIVYNIRIVYVRIYIATTSP